MFIGSEDPLLKCTAYVLAAHFIDVFDGPPNFILRFWMGLLNGAHAEGRLLVSKALDILAPVLSRPQIPESGYPQWARTTRRFLAEDGVSSDLTNLIYYLVVNSLFYPVPALFLLHVDNRRNWA